MGELRKNKVRAERDANDSGRCHQDLGGFDSQQLCGGAGRFLRRVHALPSGAGIGISGIDDDGAATSPAFDQVLPRKQNRRRRNSIGGENSGGRRRRRIGKDQRQIQCVACLLDSGGDRRRPKSQRGSQIAFDGFPLWYGSTHRPSLITHDTTSHGPLRASPTAERPKGQRPRNVLCRVEPCRPQRKENSVSPAPANARGREGRNDFLHPRRGGWRRWRPRYLDRPHTLITSLHVKIFVSVAGRAVRLHNMVRRNDSRREQHRSILVLPDQNRVAIVDPGVLKMIAGKFVPQRLRSPTSPIAGG